MAGSYRIARAAELKTLTAFRDFIEGTCRHEGVDEQTCFELKLAVDEACTNVITHGYAGMNPGSLILELAFAPPQVVVRLTDFGHPFEPSETPAPDPGAALDGRPTGGFGLYFIYRTMDGVDYRVDEQGNHLIFTKRLASVQQEFTA